MWAGKDSTVVLRSREDDAKACFAAHHAFVDFIGALQGEHFRDRAEAGQDTESKCVLRINRRARRRPDDRAASEDEGYLAAPKSSDYCCRADCRIAAAALAFPWYCFRALCREGSEGRDLLARFDEFS